MPLRLPRESYGIKFLPFIPEILAEVKSIATSKYDRAGAFELSRSSMEDHFNCAVYKICKNLARDWEIFREFFDRKGQDVLEAKLRDTYYLVLWVYDLCHYPNSLFRDIILYIEQL